MRLVLDYNRFSALTNMGGGLLRVLRTLLLRVSITAYTREPTYTKRVMMGRKPVWWRRFWIEASIFIASIAVLEVALYLFKIIDLNGLAEGIVWMFTVIFVVYGLRHILLDVLSDKTLLRTNKIAYTVGGASFATIGGMILAAFIVFAFKIPESVMPEPWFRLFLVFGATPIVGAVVGYWIGKRRGFRTQVTEWRETHRETPGS